MRPSSAANPYPPVSLTSPDPASNTLSLALGRRAAYAGKGVCGSGGEHYALQRRAVSAEGSKREREGADRGGAAAPGSAPSADTAPTGEIALLLHLGDLHPESLEAGLGSRRQGGRGHSAPPRTPASRSGQQMWRPGPTPWPERCAHFDCEAGPAESGVGGGPSCGDSLGAGQAVGGRVAALPPHQAGVGRARLAKLDAGLLPAPPRGSPQLLDHRRKQLSSASCGHSSPCAIQTFATRRNVARRVRSSSAVDLRSLTRGAGPRNWCGRPRSCRHR